jgi:hypothetical protein
MGAAMAELVSVKQATRGGDVKYTILVLALIVEGMGSVMAGLVSVRMDFLEKGARLS